MIIRPIAPRDNQAVANMIRQVFEEHDAPRTGTVYSDPTTDDLFTYFQKQGAYGLVAERECKIVGSCGIYPTDDLPDGCVEMVKFYIEKESRGLGIGKALMQAVEEKANELGYQEIYIESLPLYARAVTIYEKHGYEWIDQPLGNSGHGSCNVWMLKKLK